MQMLSEDDINLRDLSDLSDEELALAWDLWFDLAQATNDWDPPYSHGVFVNLMASSHDIDEKPLQKEP
jgi:hypothetical protein